MSLRNFVPFTALAVAAFSLSVTSAKAGQVGEILACYACQSSGNASVDSALAASPGVASDGPLFAFVNTSSSAISGGTFSVSNATPADSFTLPSIGAGSTYILVPGVTTDSGTHASGGLFGSTGVMDTSDGVGGVTDASMFKFLGMDNGLTVTSLTAGTSTGTSGTFTPGDPGLIKPFVGNPTGGSTSLLGDGPNGDGGCSNCYFGEVATLDTTSTPPMTGTPEPAGIGLMLAGLGVLGATARRWVRKA